MSMVGRKGLYPKVVVNLYNSDGSTAGSKSDQDYHQKLFQNLPALTSNRNRRVITG